MPRKFPSPGALRQRRYRAAHPDRIAAANAAAREKGSQAESKSRADPNRERDRLQERFYRVGLSPSTGSGTISKQELRNPFLLWMDKHGVLHYEDKRSATEVIKQWQKTHGQKASSEG